MPNLSQLLKAEISRISRHEIKTAFKPLHGSIVSLKKNIVELKRKVADLEAENRRLQSLNKKVQDQVPEAAPEEMDSARIKAKTIRKLRDKLGLSQQQFARLIGISSQNVFVMEHKQGRLRFRGDTLKNILASRGSENARHKSGLKRCTKPVEKSYRAPVKMKSGKESAVNAM